MSLWFSFDPVTFIQASVEPLRAIGYAHLGQDRIHQFLIENLRIFFRSEVIIFLSPHFPTVGQSVCYLFSRSFPACAAIGLRYSCFAKIFLGKDISCNLAPLLWHFNIIHLKHYLARRILNHTGTVIIFKLVEHIYSIFRKATTKLQSPHGGRLFSVCHN